MGVCVEDRRILDYAGDTELGQEATYLKEIPDGRLQRRMNQMTEIP